MMATVFLAQPLGQLSATIVGLWVYLGQGSSSVEALDKTWRIVSSVGAALALIAIIFCFTITDSGRYTLDVQNDGVRAVNDTKSHYPSRASSMTSLVPSEVETQYRPPTAEDEPLPLQFHWEDINRYFIQERNWRYLAGTSACWFLHDFAFFGLGMNTPQTLAQL
jgi:PHS family inorganic phosphate transporter-like MFS transporter